MALRDRVAQVLRRAGFAVELNVESPIRNRPLNLRARNHRWTIGVIVRDRVPASPVDALSLIRVIGSTAYDVRHTCDELWYVTDYALSNDQKRDVDKWSPYLVWVHADELDATVAERLATRADPSGPLMCNPIWADRVQRQPRTAFVLMPLAQTWSDPVYEAISESSRLAGFSISRADELTDEWVMHAIWEAIQRADIIIADATGRNGNVFYELGIAHTLGRTTILLARSGADIPFDTKGLRHIIYDWSRPDGGSWLVSRLRIIGSRKPGTAAPNTTGGCRGPAGVGSTARADSTAVKVGKVSWVASALPHSEGAAYKRQGREIAACLRD